MRQSFIGGKSFKYLERRSGIPRNTISRWAKEEKPRRFGAGRTTKLSHETKSILIDAIKYLEDHDWPIDGFLVTYFVVVPSLLAHNGRQKAIDTQS